MTALLSWTIICSLSYLPKIRGALQSIRHMRVFQGPTNVVGIGRYISDYLRSRGVVSDLIIFNDSSLHHNHHLNLQLPAMPRWQRWIFRPLFFLFCLFRYTHFNFYAGTTLLRRNWDLPILKLFGKKIVMTYCGSDIRLMGIEKKRNPYCHLIKDSMQNRPERDQKKIKKMKSQNRWVDRFIVVRGLIASAETIIPRDKLITNIWVHNANGARLLEQPLHFNSVPMIVHAPSHPGIKGTQYVEAAIDELRAEGCQFVYRRITDMSNSEALRIYQESDIIVDQLLVGGFGTLAVEGMALGKPVCCYLIKELKAQHGPDCPIVNCTIETLTAKLRWLIESPEERRRIGLLGRDYVRRYFNREEIYQKLLEVYESL